MSKKDLLAEAAKVGVTDVTSKNTVAEIEAAINQHAAETAQAHEDDAPSTQGVRAENQDGMIVLVFGSTVPDEIEQSWTTDFSVAISRDDALQLVQDLPNVVHEAGIAAVHSG